MPVSSQGAFDEADEFYFIDFQLLNVFFACLWVTLPLLSVLTIESKQNTNYTMKNLFKFFFVAAAVVTLSTACGNKEEKAEGTADTAAVVAEPVAAPVDSAAMAAPADSAAAATAEPAKEEKH